jgi:hypothetical protein
MPDLRHHNYFQRTRWNTQPLKLCVLEGDANISQVLRLASDFEVLERRDEAGSGIIQFEFMVFDRIWHTDAQMKLIDLLVYNGYRYEVMAREFKQSEPQHWSLMTTRVGQEPPNANRSDATR